MILSQDSTFTAMMTVEMASKLNTYELRKELEKRGIMDIPEGEICHRSMLARLVKDIVAQETAHTQKRTEQLVVKQRSDAEQAKLLREQRKAEALERSRQRQMNGNYFKEKVEKNTIVINDSRSKPEYTNLEVLEEEEMNEKEIDIMDPFRQAKQKSRIHIR